ncbi:hypothetical protein G647_07726 [Cladophialophora carrionii CBS 160.54]|uniref:Mitochondrial carrier protein pet8 n=1 Tax=Cladophialophora carrionii CBS 160.54 TaxID=1279043 RepID=V9D3C0_9EURO|nr:uncharacterized protein G647_07726 [Cladophialophora carrionii CBS 160.54]ETI21379.1 hypothetical protein G647_07726 [Cladophialophora carrionii CBS 160.54]
MSYLARASAPLRNAGRAFTSRSIAGFHTSAARLALSEDHPHNEGRAENIDRHKADSLDKAKTGRGEWKPELASQSEQITHASKNDMTMEEMQNLTKQKAEKDKSGQNDPSK